MMPLSYATPGEESVIRKIGGSKNRPIRRSQYALTHPLGKPAVHAHASFHVTNIIYYS